MATHDYVIANQSGAAFRTDLNNALAAIVSNNSNSSSPSTTYAYQWWADTGNNLLKIRNSANNAWITLRELDGTLLLEDGSQTSPALAFADDKNTGIFSGGDNIINITADGVERLKCQATEVVINDPSSDMDFRVESNGNQHMLYVDGTNDRVAMGHGSPSQILHLKDSNPFLEIEGTTTSGDSGIFINANANHWLLRADNNASANIFTIKAGDTSSSTHIFALTNGGKCGIGTTSPDETLHVHKASAGSASSSSAAVITLENSDTAVLQFLCPSNKSAQLRFGDPDDTGAGFIDYNHSSNFLSFGTNGPERMRLDATGNLGIGDTNPDSILHCTEANPVIQAEGTGASGDAAFFLNGKANHWLLRCDNSNSQNLFSIKAGDTSSSTHTLAINASGNVGIGVTSISTTLHVDGTILATGGVYFSAFNGDNLITNASQGGGSAALFIGNQQITTSSDERIKKDIVNTIVNATEQLKKVRIVDFTWNDPADVSYNNKNARGKWTGAIAQEIVKVFPHIINAPRKEDSLEIDYESERKWLVEYNHLVPILIKSIQELSAKVEALEAA